MTRELTFILAKVAIVLVVAGQSLTAQTQTLSTDERMETPILSLNISRSEITADESVNISWAVANASECIASGAWRGVRATEGFESLTPGSQSGVYRYRLICGNATEVSEADISVTVVGDVGDPGDKMSESNNPEVLRQPEGFITLSDSEIILNLSTQSADNDKRLSTSSFSNDDLDETATADNNPVETTATVEPVLIHFEAESENLNIGDSTTLHWSTSGEAHCSASGTWQGVKPAQGTAMTGELLEDASFTLTCEGAGGMDTATVEVSVEKQAAPTVVLRVDDTRLIAGADTTLRWSSQQATQCKAEGSWQGERAVEGSEILRHVLTDSTFRLVCSSPGGSAMAIASIEVDLVTRQSDTDLARTTEHNGAGLE